MRVMLALSLALAAATSPTAVAGTGTGPGGGIDPGDDLGPGVRFAPRVGLAVGIAEVGQPSPGGRVSPGGQVSPARPVPQASETVPKPNPSLEQLIRMRVVFSVPGMDAVRVRRNMVYKTADGQPLHMDVYAPAETTHPHPAVILVHGGPVPRTGAKNMGVYLSYGELLAASGFVAITFDHRFLAWNRLADAGSDVTDLVSHVRKNANSLGVDPERLALWAFSGGGPFLAAPLRERPSWLRAVLAYYSVLDLEQPPPGSTADPSVEIRQTFSAVASLRDSARNAPPLLVARAGLDTPWLNAGIDRFVQVALANGATVDLLNHHEGRHAFDILDDDARSKAIIRRTIAFLRDHLAPEALEERRNRSVRKRRSNFLQPSEQSQAQALIEQALSRDTEIACRQCIAAFTSRQSADDHLAFKSCQRILQSLIGSNANF